MRMPSVWDTSGGEEALLVGHGDDLVELGLPRAGKKLHHALDEVGPSRAAGEHRPSGSAATT